MTRRQFPPQFHQVRRRRLRRRRLSHRPHPPRRSNRTQSAHAAPQVEGEHFEICHEVRDGHAFDLPAPTRKVEVVIVGAGSAGLSAAYFLRGKDFLLLEKEDHFGGNAYQEEFEGQPFATGSAYAFRGDQGDQLSPKSASNFSPSTIPIPPSSTKPSSPTPGSTAIDESPLSQSRPR